VEGFGQGVKRNWPEIERTFEEEKTSWKKSLWERNFFWRKEKKVFPILLTEIGGGPAKSPGKKP